MLDWLACALVKLFGGVLRCLPPGAAVWLGERFGELAYWLQHGRTQIGLRNLRAAYDGALNLTQARRIVRACYRQLGAGAIELLRLPVMDRAYVERYVTIEQYHYFDAAVKSGRPVVLLTGHYGNWELSSIVAALIGYPIFVLARAQETLPKLYRLLVSYRESKGCTVVHKGGAMRRLIAALEQGGLVGIVGDQASRRGLPADLFGRPALFATGPFELAYGRNAVIVPSFIHRVRGPFHRLVIEPPIELLRQGPKAASIQAGVEQFAALLARHVREEPGQWLWMHKRWKHTPARWVLVLNDGKLGHLKQSLAVVEALKEQRPELTHQVVDIQYRHGAGRLLALLWSWWTPRSTGAARCLAWALAPASSASLLSRYADIIISCGASTAPVNLLWSAANDAKPLVIMNPAPLPLRRFSLVIAPRHDALPRRANVVQVDGAIVARMREDDLRAARERLAAHPNYRPAGAAEPPRPVIAVFVGGDTDHYAFTAAFAEALIAQVQAACEAAGGSCLVTTSRRTPPEIEHVLAERLGHDPRCRLLLIASRDPIDGTMDGMLGSADAAVVTGESVSMVSESCASGRRVLVVEPPLRRADRARRTKHRRFLRGLALADRIRLIPVEDLGPAIQVALKEREPVKRLETYAIIQEAVKRLL